MLENPKHDIPPRARIFRGNTDPHEVVGLPDPPPWREFAKEAREEKGKGFRVLADSDGASKTVDMVNAALMLRRPLLVTGAPGTGKSTLAFAVAHELKLDDVLVWPITTKTTLQSGLYQYDAIGRLSDAAVRRERLERRRLLGETTTRAAWPGAESRGSGTRGIGRFLTLGPLGTALLPSNSHLLPEERNRPASGVPIQKAHRPRVLLIDEIDKGDIDLPNDLLHVFELGRYEVPELARLPDKPRFRWARVRTNDEADRYAWIERGLVSCDEFPLVIMTSNGEREFPPAFLRRCLRLEMSLPNPDELRDIVLARLKVDSDERDDLKTLIKEFCDLRDGTGADPHKRVLAVDQLLNAVFLVIEKVDLGPIREALLKTLSGTS